MKNFEILLNHRYTATTQAITSGLDLQNDYYVYINRNGGGIVNPYNVRGYLNDSRNQQIITDFFAYLTGSTTQDQALNILTSDKKLSDTFNNYYQNYIISATSTINTAVIDQKLTGITQEIYGASGFTQNDILLTEDFTTDESYYLPVYLERGINQLSRHSYDLCDVFINAKTAGFYPQFSGITGVYFGTENIPNIMSDVVGNAILFASLSNSGATVDTRIHTLLDCFVDLNLEINENVSAPPPLLTVSFEYPSYVVDEGITFPIMVSLNSPSVLGIEQATIDLITPVLDSATLGLDYSTMQSYPIVFSWSAGEQYKFLDFTALNDYLLEPTENYLLQISNIINLDPGTYLNSSVGIVDTTVLRTASLSVAPPAVIAGTIPGAQFITVPEGEFIDITINLDAPAFGVETVTLSLVYSAATIGGAIGPSINPPTLNIDYKISATSMVFSFLPGETQKTFRFSAFTDVIIENTESLIFELQNPLNCLINDNFKVLAVGILDITGGYKYVHLNMGTIYSEFGYSQTTTLMRQINPQPDYAGGPYANIYTSQYANNLIEYGTTINFADYTNSAGYFSPYTHDSAAYNTSLVKVKITNEGVVQSIVNGLTLNVGQTTIIGISGNSFIITATTNNVYNSTTNLYDYADYKVEIINNYTGTTFSTVSINPPVRFALRTTGNTLSTDNTLYLGNYSLSGMTTVPSNTIGQYKLKSKYKNVNTGRPNVGSSSVPIYTCPPVATFSTSITFSEFTAQDLENISVLGIIFLNYATTSNYNNNSMSQYDSFDFISSSTPYSFTCAKTFSEYSGLNYISIPFQLEP